MTQAQQIDERHFTLCDDDYVVDLFAAGAFDDKLLSSDLCTCRHQLADARKQIEYGDEAAASKMLSNLARLVRQGCEKAARQR